ncbi:hypothetical protein AAVH_30547 [Aphelenchoides avenae]|nr:hypothetical protein AAVH_30547 [Aphelenchus avenae]
MKSLQLLVLLLCVALAACGLFREKRQFFPGGSRTVTVTKTVTSNTGPGYPGRGFGGGFGRPGFGGPGFGGPGFGGASRFGGGGFGGPGAPRTVITKTTVVRG